MTTIIERPATPTTFVPPATRFRRRAMGAAAVVGGLLTAAGFAATVWETGPDKLAYLDSLVVDPLRSQARRSCCTTATWASCRCCSRWPR